MHSFFIDSTSGLTIGLMRPDFSWIEYLELAEKKPSEVIHFEIFNLLQKHGLCLSHLQLFVSSGPGSYTGMRLSEGLAQIFELSQIPVYSFYHFDIPRLTGTKNGFWVTNAFKGQVFLYQWNELKIEKQLVNKEEFVVKDSSFGFTLDNSDMMFSSLTSTKEIIKNKASELFGHIVKVQNRVPPYYFRSLDEEFC